MPYGGGGDVVNSHIDFLVKIVGLSRLAGFARPSWRVVFAGRVDREAITADADAGIAKGGAV